MRWTGELQVDLGHESLLWIGGRSRGLARDLPLAGSEIPMIMGPKPTRIVFSAERMSWSPIQCFTNRRCTTTTTSSRGRSAEQVCPTYRTSPSTPIVQVKRLRAPVSTGRNPATSRQTPPPARLVSRNRSISIKLSVPLPHTTHLPHRLRVQTENLCTSREATPLRC